MKLLGRLKAKKALAAVLLAMIIIPMTMVVAFANEGGESIGIDYSSIFSEEMFTPLLEGITSNVGVLLPVGLGLFAIFLVPRIIRWLIDCYSCGVCMAKDMGGSKWGFFVDTIKWDLFYSHFD